MADLIDRQAALESIDNAIDTFDEFSENRGLTAAKEIIRELPSAQPQSPCDLCRFNPPSSMDGKPCCVCPAEGRREEDENQK